MSEAMYEFIQMIVIIIAFGLIVHLAKRVERLEDKE